MRTKIKEQSGAKRQKQRGFNVGLTLPIKTNGDSFFCFSKQFRFDLVYLKLIRRTLKRAVKGWKRQSRGRRVWLNLKQGYPISKKCKNARRGKGHGSFFRWAIRLYPNNIFLSFRGFNVSVLNKLQKRLFFWVSTYPHLIISQPISTGFRGYGRRYINVPTYGAIY